MHHLCTYNIWLIAYARHVYKMLVQCNTESLLEIINKLIDMHVLCLIRLRRFTANIVPHFSHLCNTCTLAHFG